MQIAHAAAHLCIECIVVLMLAIMSVVLTCWGGTMALVVVRLRPADSLDGDRLDLSLGAVLRRWDMMSPFGAAGVESALAKK